MRSKRSRLASRFNTIDIDGLTDRREIERILRKIALLECAREIWYRISPSLNGVHIKIRCARPNCHICRLVFDDEKRFYADQLRPLWRRDVLWSEKHVRGLVLKPDVWIKFK